MSDGSGAAADPLGAYLRDIEVAPFLDAEQEADLAKQIKAGTEASRMLDRGSVAAAIVEELRGRVRRGERARHRLVESNLRLVVSIAREFEDRGWPLLDLIQEGNIGLLRAIERFDPAAGSRFSAFAFRWIRQAILDAIANLPPPSNGGAGL